MNLDLTPRQREVLEALVAGDGTTIDIADRLGCGTRTVDTHMTSIRNKLHLHTRTQLAVWWLITGRYR